MKNRWMIPNIKEELGEIKGAVQNIKKKVEPFLIVELVVKTSLSKITPVLE